MARVTLSADWFAKILKDYSDWRFAFAREAGQNSLDAGATGITVDVALNADGDTVVTWSDNGKGMNRVTLETRFMAVGGSLKEEGNAGGFGIAKLILAFAHKRYTIRTGNVFVTGANDDYNVTETKETAQGLTLTTTIAGDCVVSIQEKAKLWVSLTSPPRPVLFYLNGQHIPFMGKLGAPTVSQDWCAIHSLDDSKLESGVYVRINGQYMFPVYSSVNRAVIVELTGSSLVYLTSNRDGLQYQYRNKLEKLVEAMTRDPEALFDTESDVIELFHGELGAAVDPNAIEESADDETKVSTGAGRPVWDTDESDAPRAIAAISPVANGKLPDTTIRAPRKLPGNDVVILNKTNKAIPDKYTVKGMRPMEWKLLARWTRIVQTVARILGMNQTIRTGWIFSITAQACYKATRDHGSLVLLNPCKLEGNKFVKGFDTSRDSFYTLVSLAVHELTHARHSYHDETYAGALTDNMAKVFANFPLINKAK